MGDGQRDRAVLPLSGTPRATVHILSAEGHMLTDPRVEFFAIWDGAMWNMKGSHPISPAKSARCGFLYVRESSISDAELLARWGERRNA